MPELKPWDLPLGKVYASLPIKVFIYDLKNHDDIIHELDLDLGNIEDRKYLGRVTAWALTRHYSVETMHKDDAEGK